MKVLFLTSRPLAATALDQVLLTGLKPTALDVCPTLEQALPRLTAFPPDLIVVSVAPADTAEATRRLQEHAPHLPVVILLPPGATPWPSPDPGARPPIDDALDPQTRGLLYATASIGHVSTTPGGDILHANDVAARLLGHFSPDALGASGRLPAPLLDAAGAYARRPARFELCLQHGEDGPLHWIDGLALPQGGTPASVTWFLMDASEQRLQTRRARFLRRMEALTHVLSAATAECATLLEIGSRALDAARANRPTQVDVEGATEALSRTQAVLTQLAGFARRRARRPVLREIRALLEQVAPVLVHVTGEDVSWTLDTGDEPLYASLDASELEQCLTALVTQGREALPLGGHLRLTLRPLVRDLALDEGRGTRPEIEIEIELRGYGLQPLVIPPAVHTQALHIGAELSSRQPDHLTSRVRLLLPRVFVTS